MSQVIYEKINKNLIEIFFNYHYEFITYSKSNKITIYLLFAILLIIILFFIFKIKLYQ
jgi:hypothetical protein